MAMIMNPYRFVLTLSYVDVSTSGSNTIAVPSGVQSGDLLVLFDTAYNASSDPTSVTPSGFTTGKTYAGAATRRFRSLVSHKVAAGTEGGTNLTGMNDTSEVKCLWVYRPSKAITSVTYAPTWGETVNAANPVSVSTTDAAIQSGGSMLVVGAAQALDVDPTFTTESPSFDATHVAGSGSTVHGRFGRKLYNSSPSEHTIDMGDEGTFNGLIIGWLNVT